MPGAPARRCRSHRKSQSSLLRFCGDEAAKPKKQRAHEELKAYDFFPSRNAPITRQVKRMLLAIYTRVGGLCPGPPRATAAAAARRNPDFTHGKGERRGYDQ